MQKEKILGFNGKEAFDLGMKICKLNKDISYNPYRNMIGYDEQYLEFKKGYEIASKSK
jgi:hypothetical protein